MEKAKYRVFVCNAEQRVYVTTTRDTEYMVNEILKMFNGTERLQRVKIYKELKGSPKVLVYNYADNNIKIVNGKPTKINPTVGIPVLDKETKEVYPSIYKLANHLGMFQTALQRKLEKCNPKFRYVIIQKDNQ